MKELAVFLVGTQRGTNPGRRVNAAVWRAHLVRVILPQHFRELDVKRLEYPGLRTALEFDDVILLNRDGHGTVETRGDPDIPSPCGQHPVEHELALHVDGIDRRDRCPRGKEPLRPRGAV